MQYSNVVHKFSSVDGNTAGDGERVFEDCGGPLQTLRPPLRTSSQSPDFISRKVHNSGDEVLAHYDGANLFPVGGALAQQQTDGLQSQLDCRRRVGHRSHLH